MRLVERHIIKDNRFEDICLKSGLLYNYVLYNIRQGIFDGNYLKEYELSTKLCKENQFDFRNLPAAVSQQVISQVFSVIGSWIRSKKEYEKNPSKFSSKPRLPKYKRGKKQNMIVFTTSACRLKSDGCIHFIKNIVQPIKTKIGDNKLCQVRVIPQATCYVVEVIYEKKEQDLNLNKDNVLSIDLGKLCFGSYDLHDVADTKVMSEFLHREGGRYWVTVDGVRQLYRRIECKMCFEVIEKLKKL